MNKAVKTRYENNTPYIVPRILSKTLPSICLSRSELIIIRIFFKIKSEIKKIIGIAITILIIVL